MEPCKRKNIILRICTKRFLLYIAPLSFIVLFNGFTKNGDKTQSSTYAWTQSGLSNFEVSGIWAKGSNIIAGAYLDPSSYVYLFLSTDDGLTWRPVDTILIHNTNPLSFNIQIPQISVFGDSTNFFVGIGDIDGDSGNVYLSTDNGVSWTEQDSSFPRNISSFAIIDTTIFVAGGSGVELSTDNCISWSATSEVPAVWVLCTLGNVIFAGTEGYGIFRSTNNGANWVQLDTAIYYADIATVGDILFAGASYGSYSGGGLFASSDSGMSWSADTALADHKVNLLFGNGSDLFAETSSGLYFSASNGGKWKNILAGTFADSINIEALTVCDSNLLVGTAYGVWSCPLSEITAVKRQAFPATPTSFNLEQNYPNPFNPTTTITYQLSTLSNVTLKVYDVLGRLVETLVDGRQTPGKHSVMFDASRLSSGIYFYRISAGEFSSVKKLVVIK